MAWAFARLKYYHEPLFDSFAVSSRSIPRDKKQLAEHNVGMLLWAFSGLRSLSHAWRLLGASQETGQRLDGVMISGLATACQQRGLHLSEVELLLKHMAHDALRPVILNTCALRLAWIGDAEGTLRILRMSAREGVFNAV